MPRQCPGLAGHRLACFPEARPAGPRIARALLVRRRLAENGVMTVKTLPGGTFTLAEDLTVTRMGVRRDAAGWPARVRPARRPRRCRGRPARGRAAGHHAHRH